MTNPEPEPKSLEERLAVARSLRTEALDNYRELVEEARLLPPEDTTRVALFSAAVRELFVDELTHPDLIEIARHQRKPVLQVDSLWSSIVKRRRMKQLGPVPEKNLGISKYNDEKFAELVGVKTTKAVFRGTFADIPRDARMVVVKPIGSSDSKGAFYVLDGGQLVSIADSDELEDWTELEVRAIKQLGGENLDGVEWQVQKMETFAGKPARDFKFYIFYGQIGLILEASRFPEREYAYFNEDFTSAACGRDQEPRFRDTSRTFTNNGGISEQQLEMVRNFSASIPVPFMRIDFLYTDDGLVLCEFSSAPGDSHTWSPEYDRMMGTMYLDAERRLISDLLAGKTFPAFSVFNPHK
ncbi:ATP-grasp fold amidoligase family protein [Demequina aurantiaca]|uniref:ATP-grasp fold amidoligase family protein n=1 Tax=Demequina aurantiaca TaxID=676200 RepID=UPI0007866172|nr:ATP-grasp fold amidoligase family protein [Demequina aurantiaca]